MHTRTIKSLYYASAACSTMFSGNKQILKGHSVSHKKCRYHKKKQQLKRILPLAMSITYTLNIVKLN